MNIDELKTLTLFQRSVILLLEQILKEIRIEE